MSNRDEPEEIVLKGGRANVGDVVRIGDQVARPSYPQTQTVDHFLRYLRQVGLAFVPDPVGSDDQGRQRLGFISGVAPTPPYPDWAFKESLLVEVAQHQHQLHVAAQAYEAPADAVWAVSAGDYFPRAALDSSGAIVCHNDLGMPNVIVDDHRRLVGVIDFDYCRPVDPLFDIAVAVRHWAPFGDLDLVDAPSLDRVKRFGIFCDVHELGGPERTQVVELAVAFLEHARLNIKALAAAGGAGFQALLDSGYERTNLATTTWLRQKADALAAT